MCFLFLWVSLFYYVGSLVLYSVLSLCSFSHKWNCLHLWVIFWVLESVLSSACLSLHCLCHGFCIHCVLFQECAHWPLSLNISKYILQFIKSCQIKISPSGFLLGLKEWICLGSWIFLSTNMVYQLVVLFSSILWCFQCPNKESCMPLGTSCPLSLIPCTLDRGEVRSSLS